MEPNSSQLSDDKRLRSFGYEPQLDRSMGAWNSFSISISCMCVTAGIFTTYAYAIGLVGPIFVWTWLIVSIGQIVIALVLAELAGRMPISGYAYQWTSRLMNSHYGWFVGWLGLMAFIPGFTGLNFGLAPVLLNVLGIEPSTTTVLIVVFVVTLSQLAINVAGVKIASKINSGVAFVVEIGLSVVMTVILLVVGFITNPVQSPSFLTTNSTGGSGLITALVLSSLLAMWVLTGFEGAADLAEETKMATHHVPQAVIRSLIFAVVIGFAMIIAFTINIPDVSEAASGGPSYILESALGHAGATLFEGIAIVALYAGGLANMAAASRLTFSMARDNMLPGSKTLQKVSTRRAPAAALYLVTGIALILALLGNYVSAEAVGFIVGMAAVGYYGVYGLTVLAVIVAARRGGLSEDSGFSLGKYAGAVRLVALVWSAAVLVCLIVPEGNRKPAMVGVAFLVLATIWWVAVLRGRLSRGEAGVPASLIVDEDPNAERVLTN